ncbi:MAG: hypothetical protein WEA76_00295 [Acidimicrobiia bacterium]
MPTHPFLDRKRSVIDVDARGRVSLAKFGLKDTQVVVEETEDGGLMLYPAVVLTPAELRHLADPDAVAGLEAAMESVERGDLHRVELRSDPSD